jgi:hypothetical protein
VHGLLSVARLLSLRAMILLTLRAIEIVILGSQERHTARTLPEAQIMDSSTDCGEDDCWNVSRSVHRAYGGGRRLKGSSK